MEDNGLIKLELDPTLFDAELSQLMEERFEFAQRVAADNPLMSIVHSMSVLECYFVGTALKDERKAHTQKSSPKDSEKKIHEWGLECLTKVINEMGIISDETRDRCLRFNQLRNRIHIYQHYLDNKKKLKTIDKTDAETALGMVKSIISNINAKFNIQISSKRIELSPSKKLLLAKLILIGSFYPDNENDKRLVCQFLGCSYNDCYDLIENLRVDPDFGIEKKQGVYYFNRRYALWSQLSETMKNESFKTYTDIVVEALLSFQSEQKTSYQFNKGLVQGLQLLGEDNLAVKEICRRLLRREGEFFPFSRPAEASVWHEMSGRMVDIAIAAPETFLYTFEDCQKFNYEIIQNILSSENQYKEDTVRSVFRALEQLALDEQYFSRASRIILNAQQARIGDKDWLNEILYSLINISRGYLNLKRSDMLLNLVSLSLATKFALSSELLYFILNRTKYNIEENGVLVQTILNDLVDLSIGPEALIKLSEYSVFMEQNCFEAFTRAVSRYIFSQDQRFKLIDSMKSSLRRIKDGKYEEIQRSIDLFIETFETNELVRTAHELFDGVVLHDEENFLKQRQLIKDLLCKNDYHSIVMLSNVVKNYFRLTEILFKLANEDIFSAIDHSIYPLVNKRNDYRKGFDSLYSRNRFQHHGMSWIRSLKLETWSQDEIISLLHELPITDDILAFVNNQPEAFQADYWRMITFGHLYEHDANEIIYERLLKYNNVRTILSYFDIHIERGVELSQITWRQMIQQIIDAQSEISCSADTLEFILSHFDDVERLGYEQQLFALFHRIEQVPTHYSLAVMHSPSEFIDLFDRVDTSRLNESEDYRHQFGDSYFVLHHLDGFPGMTDGVLDEMLFKNWWNEVKDKYEHTDQFDYLLSVIGEFLVRLPLIDSEMLYPSIILELLNNNAYNSLRISFLSALFNHEGGQILFSLSPSQKIQKCKELKERFEHSSPAYPIFAKVFVDLANSYKSDSFFDDETRSIYDVMQRFENQPMRSQE